jgi:hypothetical protein
MLDHELLFRQIGLTPSPSQQFQSLQQSEHATKPQFISHAIKVPKLNLREILSLSSFSRISATPSAASVERPKPGLSNLKPSDQKSPDSLERTISVELAPSRTETLVVENCHSAEVVANAFASKFKISPGAKERLKNKINFDLCQTIKLHAEVSTSEEEDH